MGRTQSSPGSHAEGSGSDSQPGVSCLASSCPPSSICSCPSIHTHSPASTWPIRVHACLLPHLSPLMDSPLVRGWLHLPALHAGSQQIFTGLAASSRYECGLSLSLPPTPPLLEQVSEMAKNIVTFHFPPDECGVFGTKLFLLISILESKGDGDSPCRLPKNGMEG